jgi:hypothetical protein
MTVGLVTMPTHTLLTICDLVADQFPNATFDGMDLSPIQPDWVPENVSFMVDDIEHVAGWTYEEDKLDYIHIRHLIHSIKNRREMWKRIYRYFLLKPYPTQPCHAHH